MISLRGRYGKHVPLETCRDNHGVRVIYKLTTAISVEIVDKLEKVLDVHWVWYL